MWPLLTVTPCLTLQYKAIAALDTFSVTMSAAGQEMTVDMEYIESAMTCLQLKLLQIH